MTAPVFFKDSIAARAAPLRYRQIGNPYAFLNGVGIESILDEVRKGHNLVEIAEVLDISIGVMLTWIENEGHTRKLEDAFKFSAEGYLAAASKAIRAAEDEFALKKAKEMANHGRFMASKMDKSKYGTDQKAVPQGNLVQFVLHMGGAKPQVHVATLDSTTKHIEHAEIRNDDSTFAMFPTPQGVAEPDSIGPFLEEPFEPDVSTLPEYLQA